MTEPFRQLGCGCSRFWLGDADDERGFFGRPALHEQLAISAPVSHCGSRHAVLGAHDRVTAWCVQRARSDLLGFKRDRESLILGKSRSGPPSHVPRVPDTQNRAVVLLGSAALRRMCAEPQQQQGASAAMPKSGCCRQRMSVPEPVERRSVSPPVISSGRSVAPKGWR